MVGNKAQKAVAAALTGLLAVGTAAPAFACVDLGNNWWRVDGSHTESYAMDTYATGVAGSGFVDGVDRYDTMWDAVATNENDGIWEYGKIVLVSGTSYADALAANGLAGCNDAPIITTPGNELGKQAEKAIKYFAKQFGDKVTVYVVGGTAAISDDVVDDISDLKVDGKEIANPIRIKGDDRIATSLAVTKYVEDGLKNSGDKLESVFVANGWAWADALSTSSFAYSLDAPLLLTNSDGSLSDDQLEYLEDKIEDGVQVWVIGGPSKLAYDTLSTFNKKVGGLFYVSGDDRYDTSALLIKRLSAFGVVGSGTEIDFGDVLAVATGENWPDALVGGAFIGSRGGVLALVGNQDKSGKNWNAAAVAASDVNDTEKFDQVFVLGGEDAVSKMTVTALKDTIA